MFDMTVCGYPNLVLNFITQYYGVWVFILLLISYFLFRYFSTTDKIGEKIACMIFGIFFSTLIILVGTASQFFNGDISHEQYKTFTNSVNELNTLSSDLMYKKKLNEWVQCSIVDGKITSYEFETFEKYFNDAKKSVEEKQFVNKISQSINK